MVEVSPSVLVIDPDAASRNYLAVMLRKAGYTALLAGSGREGLISAWRDLPSAIVFEPVLPDISAVELTNRLRQDRRTANTPCVVLSGQDDPQAMNVLLSAGCNEYLVKSNQAMQRLVELLGRLMRGERVVRTTRKGGILVVFLSAKGGTGTSSLCANIAMCLGKNEPEVRVVVMDMVLPIGSIANIVGYGERTNLVTLAMQNPGQTTPLFFKENLPKINEWYFKLLAGSPDPESANQLAADRISDIVAALQEAYDYVFIDLGRALSRLSLPIIQTADVVALVLSTDAAAATLTQTVWDYLRQQGVDEQHVYAILNRAVGLEGLTRAEAEDLLQLRIRHAMPYLGGNFALANNRHEPVAFKFPLDAATLTLNEIAKEIVDLGQQLRQG